MNDRTGHWARSLQRYSPRRQPDTFDFPHSALLTFRGTVNLNVVIGAPDMTFLGNLETLGSINVAFTEHPSTRGLEGITSLNSLEVVGVSINLEGLVNVTSISGDVQVGVSPESLRGLRNLQTIGGSLTLSASNLGGLESLTTVGNDLTINGNRTLNTLDGLDRLSSVGGNLSVTRNENLFDCTALGLVLGAPTGPPADGVSGAITFSENQEGANSIQQCLDGPPPGAPDVLIEFDPEIFEGPPDYGQALLGTTKPTDAEILQTLSVPRVRIRNTGNRPLEIIQVGNPAPEFIPPSTAEAGGPCVPGAIIQPSGICELLYVFNPQAEGPVSKSVEIYTNAADSPSVFTLSGTGVTDADSDGIFGNEDNCPSTPNPAQEDLDGDGIGDVCDGFPSDSIESSDSDGDGIGDAGDAGGFGVGITIEDADPGCSFDGPVLAGSTVSSGAPGTPFGTELSFKLTGCGSSVRVNAFFGDRLPDGSVGYKRGAAGNWLAIPGATISGSKLSYVLVDNGPLDDDPRTGSMSDPVTALTLSSAPEAVPSTPRPALLVLTFALLLLSVRSIGVGRFKN
jgi:hypothetical protein